jgi:hypothetical protein
MTKAELLQRDRDRWVRCARQIRRAALARLDYGDTHRVGTALDALAAGAFFPDVPHLLAFLHTCDGEEACDFVLHGCATDALSDCLEIVSGKNRADWLVLHKAMRSQGSQPL